jgi:hypothetical protein
VTALDVIELGFHFSGIVALAVLYWRFRDTIHGAPQSSPADPGGDDDGSDRIPGAPFMPWSWHNRPGPGRRSGDRTPRPRSPRSRSPLSRRAAPRR